MNYKFETREFGISEEGVHFLRNRYNYKTVEFNKIEKLIIERGKELNNWLLILIIGLILTSFALFYSIKLFQLFNSNEVSRIYIEEILIPVLPLMLGVYCLYASTKNCTILRLITIDKKGKKFPMKEIERKGELKVFTEFLKDNLKSKIKINL